MPLPPGYTLDTPAPKLPPGYTLDQPSSLPVGADGPLPGMPAAPIPQGLQEGAATPKLGSSIGDVLSTVGSHVANMVSGPYKAVTVAPQNPVEQGVAASPGGRAALAAYRMVAEPTVNALQQAGTATNDHPSYDQDGNYTPTKADLYMDALPVVGPWSRQVQNDAVKKGAVAGVAGLATDILAPKAAAKVVGTGLQAAGLGTQFAVASPASRQIAATRSLVPGTPAELLTRALKPPVSYPDFEQSLDNAIPEIAKQNPVPGVAGFRDAAKTAKNEEQAWYRNTLAPHENTVVNTSPIVQAQKNSTPVITAIESPDTVRSLFATADQYSSPMTLGQLDRVRSGSNASLNSFLAQNPADRFAAEANPETARMAALNKSSRDLTYSTLANASGVPEDTIRTRQGLYGDLKDISDVAGNRNTIFGRQNPYSLQESFAMSGGNPFRSAIAYAGQRALKKVTDSDALTNAAVDRFRNQSGPVFQPRDSVMRGLQGINPFIPPMAAGRLATKTGAALRTAPLALNPFFYSAVNPPRQ